MGEGTYGVAINMTTATTAEKDLINKNIIQGTEHSERIGDKINFEQIYFKYTIQANPSETDPVVYRCAIILDRYPKNITFTPTDLFDYDGLNAYVKQHADKGRFQILYNKYHRIDPDSTPRVLGPYQVILNKKFQTQYTLTTGGIDAMSRGALWFLAWQVGMTQASTLGAMNYKVKLRYTDA